jgi:hypothetical protein
MKIKDIKDIKSDFLITVGEVPGNKNKILNGNFYISYDSKGNINPMAILNFDKNYFIENIDIQNINIYIEKLDYFSIIKQKIAKKVLSFLNVEWEISCKNKKTFYKNINRKVNIEELKNNQLLEGFINQFDTLYGEEDHEYLLIPNHL